MNDTLTKITDRFTKLPEVRAIALAGSQATGQAGAASDYDVYVYTDTALPAEVRYAIGLEFSPTAQLVDFWGPGLEFDDAATGEHFDIVFFTTGWIEDQIDRVLVRCEPSLGYSTCFLHTVRASRPLHDPAGWFGALQRRASQLYPDLLTQRIVALNYPVLRDSFSSYKTQLAKAALRNDMVSLNHRVAALLASVFDILFAINRVPHPGEKRLLDIVEQECMLPMQLREHIVALLQCAATEPQAVVAQVDQLVDSLATLLRQEGWLP